MWVILRFSCYFDSIKGPRPSRYPYPWAQTNACATLVKVDFLLDLLIGNDNLRYDTAGIQREKDGVGEQIERSCDLVDDLKQKEHCLSMAEPSLLRSNRLLKSNEKALIEEVMSLRRRAHRLTGPIEEPDCSKEGELDLLKSPHARVNQKSIIPRSKSQPKVVKKPGRRRKVVSSATQLQTIHENVEPIIPLTAKSAVVLSSESKIHTPGGGTQVQRGAAP